MDFPNSDVTFHNVFSLSKTRAFDLGRYSRGKSKAVRFDRPGVVQVFCDIHSHMSAYILVFAHRYFAITDQTGSFADCRRASRPVHPGGLARRRRSRNPGRDDSRVRRRH